MHWHDSTYWIERGLWLTSDSGVIWIYRKRVIPQNHRAWLESLGLFFPDEILFSFCTAAGLQGEGGHRAKDGVLTTLNQGGVTASCVEPWWIRVPPFSLCRIRRGASFRLDWKERRAGARIDPIGREKKRTLAFTFFPAEAEEEQRKGKWAGRQGYTSSQLFFFFHNWPMRSGSHGLSVRDRGSCIELLWVKGRREFREIPFHPSNSLVDGCSWHPRWAVALSLGTSPKDHSLRSGAVKPSTGLNAQSKGTLGTQNEIFWWRYCNLGQRNAFS